MEKKKVLIVTQELEPYVSNDDFAEKVKELAPYLNDKNMEIRLLMPKFGTINERRHRLHEVVRLSGINIIIEENDYPLILKVASLPGSRLQVYFLDNDDFFRRKAVFTDKNETFFEDNSERMVFFCKGVLETIKKFGWPPDIIHCHGWMTSLVPFYLKTAYKTDPVFKNSKVIYSVYDETFSNALNGSFAKKAAIDSVKEKDLKLFKDGDNTSLTVGAVEYADAIIVDSKKLKPEVEKKIKSAKKPVLKTAGEDFREDYYNFYTSLLS